MAGDHGANMRGKEKTRKRSSNQGGARGRGPALPLEQVSSPSNKGQTHGPTVKKRTRKTVDDGAERKGERRFVQKPSGINWQFI